jgi:hypothetical protein
MSWRLDVMEASMRHPLVDVLDRQGGATAIHAGEARTVLRIEGLNDYVFVGSVGEAMVSQGGWSAEGTLLECCAAVAARHPVEG